MKGGQPHRVPLCYRAVAIVKELATARLNQFVFPGVRRGTSLAMTTMLVFLRELQRTITVHGFRSTLQGLGQRGDQLPRPHLGGGARSRLGRQGVSTPHTRAATYFEKRRELMDAWAMLLHAGAAERRRAPG